MVRFPPGQRLSASMQAVMMLGRRVMVFGNPHIFIGASPRPMELKTRLYERFFARNSDLEGRIARNWLSGKAPSC
jgi:hypothetical protein